jgi:hypothetical protein
MTSLYRIAVPFLGIMIFGLTIIMLVPKLSTIAIEGDIAHERAKAAARNEAPRDAWMLECVQEDRNNPLPCTEEDRKKWGPKAHPHDVPGGPDTAGSALPGEADMGQDDDTDKLFEDLLGDAKEPPPSGSAALPPIVP